MGYPSPNLEQYFQFTLAVPSRDYSSSIHHSRPETHIIVQDQHIRQIVNVEDIQPKQEESPKDSQQSRGGQAKE